MEPPTPIKSECSIKYRALREDGLRKTTDIGWVVIHATEGAFADGAANWFTDTRCKGSANLVVDDNICFRTLDDNHIPWAAPPLNKKGFHIEIAGYSKWSRTIWLSHKKGLDRAAFKAALRCVKYKIPIRQVVAADLLVGRKGITTHRSISSAFHQSDHTDPGEHFPMDYFIERVKYFAAELRT